MFLAWKEFIFNKKKFSLIISLIVLITYLVYFLVSLAYGLATSYTYGLEKINSDVIILHADANDNAMMSMLSNDDFDFVQTSGEKEKLGLFPAVVLNEDIDKKETSKLEVFVFGVDNLSFFLPEYQIGLLNDNEVIIDDSAKKLGYEIGDVIIISGTNIQWEIIGFTEKSTYQTAPIIYANLDTWKAYRFSNQIAFDFYNAILVKGDVNIETPSLLAYTMDAYYQTLPGYTAQVLTFSMMIIFLIVIIAFVLGIFIYVLTIQKSSMFGVMKAQGISNAYIGLSVIMQTTIIVAFGAAIGFALTLISGYFLSGIVPFAINVGFYVAITLSFFIFSVLGGLFSVSTIVKIDPLKAIG